MKRQNERGTTLLLFPAAFIVISLLSALCIDTARVFHAQRQGTRIASQAADDAAAMIDLDRLYLDGTKQLDPVAAEATAAASVSAATVPGSTFDTPTVTVDVVASTVTVSFFIDVHGLLVDPISGAGGRSRIAISSSARLDHAP